MNNRRWMPILIVLGILAVIGLGGVRAYNNMVTLNEGVDAAWAQVENVLQRRYDLIPNLVNTVKGYAKQEREVLEEVTRLRSQWGAAKTTADKVQASQGLEGALSRLMVVLENYPQLKSNQNFLALQDELAGTENRIAVERMRFNDAVRSYNVAVQRFPTSLVARLSHFQKRDEYFEAEKGAAQAPKVEF